MACIADVINVQINFKNTEKKLSSVYKNVAVVRPPSSNTFTFVQSKLQIIHNIISVMSEILRAVQYDKLFVLMFVSQMQDLD